MVCQGKTSLSVTPANRQRRYIVGEGDDPVYIGTREEINALFTPEFFTVFNLWRMSHYKIGLPYGAHTDPFILGLIMNFEAHYERHFSQMRVIIQYLEILIKGRRK